MPNDIDRKSLQEMFDQIRANTSWNLEGDLVWGYVFTDESEEKLVAASEDLVKRGFVNVGVYEAEEDDEHEHGEHCSHDHDDEGTGDEVPMFVLQVEEVKCHTIDSLHTRNQEMSAFAAKHHLRSYDGIEVGEAPDNLN